MKHTPTILILLAAAFVPFIVPSDDGLEAWKATTDARLDALENPPKPEGTVATPAAKGAAASIFEVTVTNKRWDPQDLKARPTKYDDNIWFDVEYKAVGLKKEARSAKGVLQFCDLFGDPQYQVRVTVSKKLRPGKSTHTRGVGMTYSQFDATHGWIRTNELSDMTFKFQVTHVLYTDGTTEKFGS